MCTVCSQAQVLFLFRLGYSDRAREPRFGHHMRLTSGTARGIMKAASEISQFEIRLSETSLLAAQHLQVLWQTRPRMLLVYSARHSQAFVDIHPHFRRFSPRHRRGESTRESRYTKMEVLWCKRI